MRVMSEEEWKAFLTAEPPRTGKLAPVRKDGRPHVAPIWFDLDGDVVVFTTWHTSVKATNLRRDPRLALCVDDESPPFAYAVIEGIATFDETAEVRYWAARIGARYMGADRAEEFGKRNGVPGELVVRLRPTKIVADLDVTG